MQSLPSSSCSQSSKSPVISSSFPLFSFYSSTKHKLTFCFLLDPFIFLGDEQGNIEIWNVFWFKLIFSWKAHLKAILSLSAFYSLNDVANVDDANNSMKVILFSHSRDHWMHEWRVTIVNDTTFVHQSSAIPNSSFSPSSSLEIAIINFCPFQLVVSSTRKEIESARDIIVVIPDNKYIDQIALWNWKEKKPIARLCIDSSSHSKSFGMVMCIRCWQDPFTHGSSLSYYILAGYENGHLGLFHLHRPFESLITSLIPIFSLNTLNVHPDTLLSVDVIPHIGWIVSGGADKQIQLSKIDYKKNEEMEDASQPSMAKGTSFKFCHGGFQSVAISMDTVEENGLSFLSAIYVWSGSWSGHLTMSHVPLTEKVSSSFCSSDSCLDAALLNEEAELMAFTSYSRELDYHRSQIILVKPFRSDNLDKCKKSPLGLLAVSKSTSVATEHSIKKKTTLLLTVSSDGAVAVWSQGSFGR